MRALCLALTLLLAFPALADDDGHERAHRALREGRAMPLAQILDRVGREQPGDVIEVELEDERGRLVYEIKVIDVEGRVVKLEYDAASGELLKRKGGRR